MTRDLLGAQGGGSPVMTQQGERPRHQRGWVEYRRFRVAVWQELIGGFGWIYTHPMTWTNARQTCLEWERGGHRAQVVGLGEDAR